MSLTSLVSRIAGCAAIALLAYASSADASARTLRWTHPNPSKVAGFKVHARSASSSYGTPTNAGLPAPSNGVYSYAYDVPDTQTLYVAISAYDAQGNQSPYSNERVFVAQTTATTTTTTTRATSTTSPPSPTTTLPPQPPPPPPGSGDLRWSDDFETASIGGSPAGWYESAADNSMARGDAFGVGSVSGELAYGTTSNEVNIHSHYIAPGSEDWTSYEYRGRMLVTAANSGIGVTAYSQYPVTDAYYRIMRSEHSGFTAFRMWSHPNQRQFDCASDRTGVVPEPYRWYRFRLQVETQSPATLIRAKVWDQAGAEPAAWQVDCSDASADRLTAGRIGLWSMGGGSKYWDDLEVFDLGSEAPAPPTAPPPPPILVP